MTEANIESQPFRFTLEPFESASPSSLIMDQADGNIHYITPVLLIAHKQIMQGEDSESTYVKCNKLCPRSLKSLSDVQSEPEQTYH